MGKDRYTEFKSLIFNQTQKAKAVSILDVIQNQIPITHDSI